MAARRTSFGGNPYLGLFAKANESVVLIPKSSAPKFEENAKLMKTPVVKTSVGGSPYLGVYFAMNSRGIIVPPFLNKEEMNEVEGLGLEIMVMEATEFSAIGNNVACNDFGAIANPDMPSGVIDEMSKTLGVKVIARSIAGYKTAGMMAVATNKGWVAHNRISDAEAQMLEEIFKVKGRNSTVNSGAAMVGLGVMANSKYALCGETTTGFELGRIEEALDITQ